MKHLTKTLSAISFVYVIAAAPLLAQTVFTFDELGNGNLNGNPVPGAIAVDPFSGMPTLAYSLPFVTDPGDVWLYEPGTSGTQQLSDIVRFDGQGHVFFFSELEPGELNPDPADVPQFPPPVTSLPTVVLNEAGPEGNNGAFYAPTAAGAPGFAVDSAGVPVQYNIISDVPEPSAVVLASLGGGLLLFGRLRRQQTRVS